MSQVSIDTDIVTLETASCSGGLKPLRNLRGVRWRIDLGILPSYPSASVDDLRRVTADSRRRYAALRRQLLVDPHVPKDGGGSPDHFMDNPLSQNPDSTWGRFFRNAELERVVDQDLTRLYPERSSYFQTNECQGILRRILLLWCLRHPEYGYRQGMHELLAPLLYVLHVDVEHLSEVKKTYADHFSDKFDGFSYYENDLTYKFDFKKFSNSVEDGNGFKNTSAKTISPSELDPEVQTIVLLNDAYGAEGELGIVLSEKFMEHDAYSMFDSLMCGSGGSIAMAEFFSPSPFGRSRTTGSPPVIEASAAIYHLLSIIDSSLHTHLVELEVEPQYFALRWLRVLFGREFSLEDLLVIWDEIFACENTMPSTAITCDAESNFVLLESPRGAFICAFAVSMILNLRSSLLATENATICLQRLLNLPDDIELVKLLAKAKSLHSIATDANNLTPISAPSELYNRRKSTGTRGHSLSMDSSPTNPLIVVPDSYWEEKWRVLHKEEENKQGAVVEQVPTRIKGWSERVKLRLSRTESDPSPSKKNERTKIVKPSVRRSLLNDLARQLGLDENHRENMAPVENVGVVDSVEVNREDLIIEETYDNSSSAAGSEENASNFLGPYGPIRANYEGSEVVKPFVRRNLLDDLTQQLGSDEEYRENTVSDEDVGRRDIVEDTYENSLSAAGSEENSSDFSDPTGPIPENSDNENESESSVASNSSIDENDTQMCANNPESYPLPISTYPDGASSEGTGNDDSSGKLATTGKREIKQLSGKFQWLWKFGRNGNEGTSDRNSPRDAKACKDGSDQNNLVGISTADGCNRSSGANKGETVDQNLMVSFKNLGQSMIENIQVLETIFQQDRGQVENSSKNGLVGKGQVTATAALKELRKISHLLSEM